MPVVGTAGHVDHGKSTLIERLTGRDPDRWEIEKRRGLTIDLGFGWTRLSDGTEISFVDVPGHERYLKNMLAGIEAIDAALLVVAADEGWMPQSEEHLAVLDLLGIENGVVALTKIDLVDELLVELATEEVATKIAGTSLAGAPIVPVSAVTGEGIDDLLDILGPSLPTRLPDNGRPRMWIDRVFSVSGAGTVVTGTLLGGALRVGQDVTLYPSRTRARIRGLQSHEADMSEVEPGRRVAVNLTSNEGTDFERGDMIGKPGQWRLTDRLTVSLRRARYFDELTTRGAFQIHIGSTALGAELIAIDDGYALLSLQASLPLASGDRFILRDTGRSLVVAGGVVLDPSPGPTTQALRAAPSLDAASNIADGILAQRGAEQIEALDADTAGVLPTGAIIIGATAFAPAIVASLEQDLIQFTAAFHLDHPLRPGVPLASASSKLSVGPEVIEAMVDRVSELHRVGPDVALVEHQPELSASQLEAWNKTAEQLEAGLNVPAFDDLPADEEILRLMIRQGELVPVSEGLAYRPSQIESIKDLLGSMGAEFTVADFRDASGLSRKYAVPILEWADREGLTARRGDYRSAR